MSKSERSSRKRKRVEPAALPGEIEDPSSPPRTKKIKDASSTDSKKSRPTDENIHRNHDAKASLKRTDRGEEQGSVGEGDDLGKRKKGKSKRRNEVESSHVEPAINEKIETDAQENDADTRHSHAVAAATESKERSKDRKQKKAKKSKALANGAIEAKEQAADDTGAQGATAVEDATGSANTNNKKKHRFIVFVGNLPFSTTTPALTAHFAKITPSDIRHITDKTSDRSKGYAFLEFDNYDRMKTCLKLYHHSWFPAEGKGKSGGKKEEEDLYGGDEGENEGGGEADEGGKKKRAKKGDEAPRRINVELTARKRKRLTDTNVDDRTGGGGNSESRKDKLKEKNTRLATERKRRAEADLANEEESKKAMKTNKGGRTGKGGPTKSVPTKGTKRKWEHAVEDGNGDPQGSNPSADDSQGIHPSRLARMAR
ncbi:MAG: hypothetical protein Q9165_001807 [Trypethelium subeluteriae]